MVTDDLYSKPMDGEVEVGRESTQRIVNSDKFFSKVFTPSGREFFIFSEPGDFIKGILLAGSRDNSHINRTKSHQIAAKEIRQHGQDLVLENGLVEEFFANRQLQRFFRRDKLAGKCVRIVYIGRVKSGWGGHSAKAYRVFIDKGIFEESEEEVYGSKRRKTKRRKSTSVAAGR
jgi:hypothetical protein